MAKELGSEMTGVASMDRFANAPLMHSPQGLLPTAKSVVVVGVSWLDASMELTEQELSEHWDNPADACELETNMNHRLHTIVFKLAKFLEKQGYQSLPLAASTHWRYRPYKTMAEPFAPPLAHRYAAVAAGLGEIGWHESFLSPEFGPRQRICSLITEAPLVADPLYNGTPLCNKCMRCVTACPYDRFRKEVRGTKELDIGGKKFTVPLTNKWRCNLCYYQITPRFLPKEITEEVCLRIINDGRRPREFIMDSAACLAACLPPHLKTDNNNLYPHTVARKREPKSVDRAEVTDALKQKVLSVGIDYLYIGSRQELLERGIDLEQYMPSGESIVIFGNSYSDPFMNNATRERMRDTLFDLSHYLQLLGYYTLPASRLTHYSSEPGPHLTPELAKELLGVEKTVDINFHHLITALPLSPLTLSVEPPGKKGKVNTAELKAFALNNGADLIGISSVQRINNIQSHGLDDQMTVVMDQNGKPGSPSTTEDYVMDGSAAVEIRKAQIKNPQDYMPEAKSVVVFGIHFPYSVIERAAQPPAENIAIYSSVLNWMIPHEIYSTGFQIVQYLRSRGYKATAFMDMDETSLRISSNRTYAVAAGLGEFGWNGIVLTPEYGNTQVFISIVTDAELEQDPIYEGEALCTKCMKCIDNCPVKAVDKGNAKCSLEIEGKIFEFGRKDNLKCEWANRFGFVGEEGGKYMGSEIDIPLPEKINLKSFNQALSTINNMSRGDKLQWVRPGNWNGGGFDRCLCPVRGKGEM